MKNKYYCNPLNINYRYQFYDDYQSQGLKIAREAADPSLIMYKDKYYLFASMTLSVYVSDDLVNWTQHKLPDYLPLYDYAPDVRVINDYVYFSASKRGEVCHFYKTKDVLNGPYEKIEGSFDFWDPNLFVDDDGRIYFYYGCTSHEPLWGMELDSDTLKPLNKEIGLIEGKPFEIGYERVGDNHSKYPKSEEEIDIAYKAFLQYQNAKERDIPENHREMLRNMLADRPFIEGAWMDKYNDKYYLQYAAPGTQYDGYADGVYIANNPLGPFKLADNNPYSYKPGGFITGAGHGSTMKDKFGNLWHTSTQIISINHNFERRIGLWPAGYDEDGQLFCNQNYGDFPRRVVSDKIDPWEDPEWMLLSYKKKIEASSTYEGYKVENAVDENIKTWWKSNEKEGWLILDLEEESIINAIQINFADSKIDIEVPGEIRGTTQARYIEEKNLKTRWILKASNDGVNFDVVVDKSKANTDLVHDLIVLEEGLKARYLKLIIIEVPYNQNPSISGIRVFGKVEKRLPIKPAFTISRVSDLDMEVEIVGDAVGFNVLWGNKPNKLYNSYLTFDKKINVGALIKGREYYVRVDAFNEAGITKGDVIKL